VTIKTSRQFQNAAAGSTRSAATLAFVDGPGTIGTTNWKPRIMSTHKPRLQAQRTASFHDASAREAYASRFRPIAIPAIVAAQGRSGAPAQRF
jgi:hypothetical protein